MAHFYEGSLGGMAQFYEGTLGEDDLKLKKVVTFWRVSENGFSAGLAPFRWANPRFLQSTSRALPLGVVITHIQMNSMIEIIAMISSTQLSAERSVLFIIGSFFKF